MSRASLGDRTRVSGVTFDAIIVAGASSTRLGGRDKALVSVGGETMLERVVAAADGATQILVVGPRRQLPLQVTWVDEGAVEGGPVPALVCGLAFVRSEIVVLLAVDYPLLTTRDITRLVEDVERDGAVALDAEGRRQPLLAAYRTPALTAAVQRLSVLEGAAVRDVVSRLDLIGVQLGEAARDCDTWSDIETVRQLDQRR
jgi:molybdopterin-guanine dinucleotide biosynthesis protein A